LDLKGSSSVKVSIETNIHLSVSVFLTNN
jgi:hypothetical protein